MREHRAGLEKGNANADSPEIGGRLQRHTEQALVRAREDVMSDDRGVLVRRGSGDGMGAKESCRNTGSPGKQRIKAQTGIPRGTGLACVGGGEARSSEDTRNERRAKGPQFQGNATSGARAEIGASLPPAEKLLKLQETLHAKSMKTPWSESRMRETRTSGLMSGGVETGPLKDTAPPLDSTRLLPNRCNWLGNKELWNSAKYSLFLRCCSAETSKRQAREAVLSLRSAWFGILYLSSLIHHVAGCPGLVPGWRSQTWLDKSMRIPYHSPGDSPACVLPGGENRRESEL